MRRPHRAPAVALLTPYSGRNLGDGAIQFAFVGNLRRCRPGIELLGITENPARTQEIHGIPCFPLHAAARAAGNPAAAVTAADHGSVPEGPQSGAPLRNALRAIPGVRAIARMARAALRSLRRMPRELAEWRRTWVLLGRIDLLLVAGGGQLDEEWGGAWGHPYVLWRWTLCARLRGCPSAFVSVGLGVMRSTLGTWFIRQSLRRSAYRSYRDQGTRDLLAHFGFVRRDPIVPDIALSLPLAGETAMRDPAAGARTIGVMPMIFGHAELWPTANVQVYERYIAELRSAVSALLSDGWNVSLFVTNSSDRTAVGDLLQGIDQAQWPCDRLRVEDTSSLWRLLPALQACQLVIASRLHAVVLGHRLATPMLAVSFDRKVDEQMKQAGASEFCFDIRRFDHAGLLSAVRLLQDRAQQMRVHLGNYVAAAQGSLEEQYQQLVGLLERGR